MLQFDMEIHPLSSCLYLVWGWGVYREETDSRTCPPSCRPDEAWSPLPCRSRCPPWPTRSRTAPPRWRLAPRSAPTAPRPRRRRKRTWTKEEAGSPGLRWREGRSYRLLLTFLRARRPSASGAAPSAGCAASYGTSHAGSWTRPDLKKEGFQIETEICETWVISSCVSMCLNSVSPGLAPRAGWCTWPDVHASPRPGSVFSETSSPEPRAAAPWRLCDSSAVCDAESRNEPRV